ncbi:2-hydroxychromene-2-carboxylate isomerase [Magnetovibrio sp. PR-2]|uniref:2-hydroxychromene-2-carboxylate isomerase n=1 Tax=Magnetovibrio sp. PR-2 TaxID=3120356 RepID=UPI002FCE6077
MAEIDFWYEFASPYSYLSAMRIEDEAAKVGVTVNWKPLLLGPIFKDQGFQDSPFNAFPLKREYMWRDMERCAAELGLAFQKPQTFPANSLMAARLSLLGASEGWANTITKAIYAAYFGEGKDVADREMLRDLVDKHIPGDADDILARAQSAENKTALRDQVEQARTLGIFGAPMFVCVDELFWGNDRLDMALKFAAAPN